ncbi:PTR2-domain-containing protein [Neoconidiobolus thromboides FSU 785]|nr:PTR2-domain-containing protein [Neoconidiobolus thromboides FSU 785]
MKETDQKESLPKYIYLILANDFGERFCFYGIKSILFIYLKIGFGLDDVQSKIQTHLFTAFIYLFPLIGAMISDSYLGKYNTVILFSIIYLIGNILLSVFSINGLLAQMGKYPYWSFVLSSLLIAIGSGGIKPSVASHAGDQINPEKTRLLDRLFSMLYIIASVGSLIASYLTPIIVRNVECFGKPCYFLAYIIPTIIFAFAIILFAVGKKYYVVAPPVKEFLPWKCLKISLLGLHEYTKASPEERAAKGHFLNFAKEKYGADLVNETRLLNKVMIILFPLMFFWLLYDQAFTEWQNQYELMNQTFLNSFYMSAETSANLNTIFVVILVPLLSDVIYPFFKKIGRPISVVNRMIIGFSFVILAFIISTSLTYPVLQYSEGNVVKVDGIQVSCVGCVNCSWQIPQWFFLSLGEAMLCVTAVQFAYTQVGPKLKASSTAVYVLNVAFGNYIVSGIEEAMALAGFDNPATKQWIFISISSFFFLIFVGLCKFWYITKEEEEKALKQGLQQEFLQDLK